MEPIHDAGLQPRTVLRLPPRGGMVRARLGSCDVLLEGARGSFTVLWTDGRTSSRAHLGLVGDGELRLDLRLPSRPLVVTPQEPVVLAPGARLRGYLLAPVVPTVVWRAANGAETTLHVFQPAALQAEWDAERGHALRALSPWCARYPLASASDLRAVVPVRIRHRGARAFEIAGVALAADSPVHALRHGLGAPLQDLETRGEELVARRRSRAEGAAPTDEGGLLELPA